MSLTALLNCRVKNLKEWTLPGFLSAEDLDSYYLTHFLLLTPCFFPFNASAFCLLTNYHLVIMPYRMYTVKIYMIVIIIKNIKYINVKSDR